MSLLQISCTLIVYHLLSYLEEWIVPLFMWIICPMLMLTISWRLSKYLRETFLHPLMKQVQCSKKLVLITGCDSGFGLAFARALAGKGFTVFAGCYDEPNALLKSQSEANNDRIHVIPLDVTSSESVENAFKCVQKYLDENPSMSLHALINNAGVLQVGLIEWEDPSDISHFTRHMDVNCYGHIRMCKRFLPLIRSAGPGSRIINVNSMAARTATAPVSAYAISKAASASFTEAMQVELANFGIHVISIEPWIATTSLSAGDQIIQGAHKSLEKTPMEVQIAYGLKGMNLVNGWIKTAKDSFLNITIDDVVDKVTDAVTSPDPEPIIRVCDCAFSKLFTLMNELLPWRLVVFARRLMQYNVERAA